MSIFLKYVTFSYVFAVVATLLNSINMFGLGNVLVDNTNTVGGILSSMFCTANSAGVINSCSNNMLLALGVISIGTLLAGGLFTMLTFGSTSFAFIILISFVPAIANIYSVIVGILDIFGVGSLVALGIGSLFSIILTVALAESIIQIQAKVILD